MAKKKKAESQLPTDITPSLGSNYGLDGYDFYDEMGEGVLEGARLPEARGLAQLPGNLVEDKSEAPWGPSMTRAAGEPKFAEGPNLEEFVAPSSNERLPDLSWLELAEQDPDRLPKSPHNRSIPELVEAWGVHRRTDGLRSVRNNKDLALLKEASPSGRVRDKGFLLDVIRRAGRESAAGFPWETVSDNVRVQLRGASQKEAGFIAPYLEQIRREHGLAGRIFIRADFYPGYESGKWTEYVRKTAHDAFYVIKRSDSPSSIHDQNGRCGIFKKKIVASVPWKKAHSLYRKKFASSGVGISDTGNPQKDLRLAFEAPEIKGNTIFPIVLSPVREASLEESKSALLSGKKTQEKLSHSQREKEKELKKLAGALRDLVASHSIREEEAKFLLKSKKAPKQILREAIDLARTPKKVEYTGHVMKASDQTSLQQIRRKKQAEASRQFLAQLVSDGLVDKRELLSFKESGFNSNQILKEAIKVASRRSLRNSSIRKVREHIEKLAAKGLLDEKQVSLLIKEKNSDKLIKKASEAVFSKAREYSGASFTETPLERGRSVSQRKLTLAASEAKKDTLKKAQDSLNSLVRRGFITEDSKKRILSSSKTSEEIMERVASALSGGSREYSEPIYEAAPQLRQEDIEVPTKTNKVLDFLHRRMNRGLYGSKLNEALNQKFTPVELKRERDLVRRDRDEHEGLAGNLYIRALTYDEGTGTKGCTKGAEIHRGDGVQHLLGMKKCHGCVFKNPDGICQKYNKLVVEAPPVEDPKRYQQELLEKDPKTSESAIENLMRKEETGIGGLGDPASEFGLKNSNLNEFSFSGAREGSVEVDFGESMDDLELLWSN